jgi:hypothetical protein
MWQLIGWTIWLIVVLLAVSFSLNCRSKVKSGQDFQWATGVQALFLWIIAILFIFFEWNKLHILWITPISFFSAIVTVHGGVPILSPVILATTNVFLNIILIGIKKPDPYSTGTSSQRPTPRVSVKDSTDRIPEDSLWCEFIGMENTEDVLFQKSSYLAEMMTGLAWSFAVELLQPVFSPKLHTDFEKVIEVYLETISLYINAVDRAAFTLLPAKKRKFFMDSLIIALINRVDEIPKKMIEIPKDKSLNRYFGDNFINLYNQRQLEYGAFNIMLPSPSDNLNELKESAILEYGKRLSVALSGTDRAYGIITNAVNSAKNTLKVMSFKELLSE